MIELDETVEPQVGSGVVTYQLTFSRRQAKEGRHHFEVQAASEPLLKAILQDRFGRSLLKSVYLLVPIGKNLHVHRIELRRGGCAEIARRGDGTSHAAAVPGPPPSPQPVPAVAPSPQPLPAATPGTAAQAADSPPDRSCLNPPPGPSRRRSGKPRRRRADPAPAGPPTGPVDLKVGECAVRIVPHHAAVDRMLSTFGVELPEGPAWWEWSVTTSDRQMEMFRQGSATTFAAARRSAFRAASSLNGALTRSRISRATMWG